jgi:hypothetical protein
MSSNLFAITATDANRNYLSGFAVTVLDSGSMSTSPLASLGSETTPSGRTYLIYDMGNLDRVDILVDHPQFFQRKVQVLRDARTGNLSSNTRSTLYGIYARSSIANLIVPTVELVLLRVSQSPVKLLPETFPAGTAGKVLDDPRGVWGNSSGEIVNLFDAAISGDYPVVLGPGLSRDASQSDWGRFETSRVKVDPKTPTGGAWFRWLEYGDATGLKMLIAIWVIGRAGAKPKPNSTDAVVFFSPNTAISLFSPKDLYPYKRKFISSKQTNRVFLIQPYTELAYRYLSSGGSSGGDGSDFGLAYQGMATGRSLVLIMPIQMYGFWGPVLAHDGLARLVTEVLFFVSDNTVRAIPPNSGFGNDQSPRLGRLAIAGYSNGMNDVRTLLDTQTIRALADKYAAMSSSAPAVQKSTFSEMAQRLRSLPEQLWTSPSGLIRKSCRELYSIDGYFPGENKKFQNEMGVWFNETDDAMLRVYASDGRFSETEIIAGTKLDDVFRGVTPIITGSGATKSKEFHRQDGRASFAWFTEKFMNFAAVEFMPDVQKSGIDAHHTLPRVVFSHAIAQGRFSIP